MASVSLCMIVKNEEKNIRQCLDSVCCLVDEIIVVDTGSTDATSSICSEYGARIIPFTWCDDFAAARNIGIEASSCDWILCMDADENLRLNANGTLQALLEKQNFAVFRIPMIHYYGPEPCGEERSYRSTGIRLFRNTPSFRFTGRIHEHLLLGNMDQDIGFLPDICIRHFGYMDAYLAKKSGRNLYLLLEENKLRPNDPWIFYHLAVEYYHLEEYSVCLDYINKSLAVFLASNQLPPALLYKLKYHLLLNTKNLKAAYNGIDKAVQLYPDYVDLRFYQGLAQYLMDQPDKAIQTFTYCLILGESHPYYLILAGTGSFMALYYIGRCYLQKGKIPMAAEAFRQALDINPEFTQAGQALSDLNDDHTQ